MLQMHTAASTQPQDFTNNNLIQQQDNKNNQGLGDKLKNMMQLTPTFGGLSNVLNGLRDMVRTTGNNAN